MRVPPIGRAPRVPSWTRVARARATACGLHGPLDLNGPAGFNGAGYVGDVGGFDDIRGPRNPRGFTLIEVLIALAIVAIALGAVLRATGALASGTDDARARLLALWSADNALAAIRIASTWPPVGNTTFACPQGAYRFVCRQAVTAFQSPLVRQVTVSVFASATSRAVLAEAATVVQDEARH